MFPSLATVQNIHTTPHPTKSTVTIAAVRKFSIAGKLSPHRVSLPSSFNHAQEAEHHRAFPKTPTGLDALWYESGAMQNIPVPTQNGFLDKRPSIHLSEREKNRAWKPEPKLSLCAAQRDARLAQLVEHYLDTVGVTGSSPVLRTILSSILLSFFSFAFL